MYKMKKKRYAKLTEDIIGESSLNQKIKEKIPPTKFELRFKKRILIIVVRNKGRIQSEGNTTAKVLRQKTEQHIERFKSTE